MSDPLSFTVCTFARVFDTTPAHEVVTLTELTDALCRFELKPKLVGEVDRELDRLDRAWAMWEAGAGEGARWSALNQAARVARAAGEDPDAAARARYEALKVEARKGVKRLLRLWSPVRYRAGETRGSSGVESLSCLVLDFDDGTRIQDASACWESFFHIVHTTWSHTEAHHKLRLILPLVQPVRAEDWGAVWDWAERRTGQVIDPAMKGTGATYALPAVPARDWPRQAFVHEGTLLDPVAFGIVDVAAPLPKRPTVPEHTVFRDGDPEHVYLAAPSAAAIDALEDPSLWDQFSEVLIAPTPTHQPLVATPPADATSDRLAALEARIAALEGERLVDGLERLATLRATGELSEAEYTAAKAKLLAEPA